MTHMMKTFFVIAILVVLTTGCSAHARVSVSGPFIGGQDVVAVSNNIKDSYMEISRNGGEPLATISLGSTARVGFSFYDERGMMLTVKAYYLSEDGGKKMYIGMISRPFYRQNRVQPWIVDYVQPPTGTGRGGSGTGRSGGGGGRGGGSGVW